MTDLSSPFVRLFGPAELPVRIPDWPEGVGVAVCRVNGRTVSFQPYHVEESGQALKRRLPEEVGETMLGFACTPALKGLPSIELGGVEEARLLAELDNALRSMPRLVEMAADFAINFVFASEEGLGLDQLADAANRKAEANAAASQKAVTEQLPVGYVPFVQPDPNCQMIAGALLRPVGAAGIDLLLNGEAGLHSRDLPPEVQVLVRDDSLRIAVPLAPVLVNGNLPQVLRLPAGSLMLGQTGGKPVPAMVLRRGSFLFVAPDYASVSSAAGSAPRGVKVKKPSTFPWKWLGLGLGGVAVLAAVAAAVVLLIPDNAPQSGKAAPVDDLRSNLFAPSP